MWSRGWEPKVSPGSSLERQTPRPRLGLLGWTLHFNKTPRRFVCTLTSEMHCWRGSHSVHLADFTPLWCHSVCSSTFYVSSTLRVGSVSFIRVPSDFFFFFGKTPLQVAMCLPIQRHLVSGYLSFHGMLAAV